MIYSYLKQLKLRLQFTGWLQYIPTGLLALILLFIAKIISILGYVSVAFVFGLVAVLLLTILIFDLVTVKLHLHPKERLPERNYNMDIFDLMRSRRSCRSFQKRKLTPADHEEIMKSVGVNSEMTSSTMFGKEPIRFEYIAEKLTVWPVVGASEFIVAIAPKTYNRLAVIDIGHSLQKVVVEATRLGVATCWIGPGADQSSIVKHLRNRFDPDNDHIICVCAVGYKSWYKPLMLRLIQKIQRNRLPLSSLFYADSYFENSLGVEASPFNQFGRCYEVCQWSPSAFNGQTTRCVCVTEKKGDVTEEEISVVRFDFYAATKSRFYAAVALGIWCANWELGCMALGIRGHFTVLTAEERMVHRNKTDQELPRYDISWVLEK
jgi:nitroreductase